MNHAPSQHTRLRAKALTVPLALLTLLLAACAESEAEGEFDNWKEINDAYIDSIAAVARENADGSWTIYKTYNIGDNTGLDGDNKLYIYVQVLEEGDGTYSPLYNDSVRVHYSGRILPSASYPLGYQFGKSYNGSTLDTETDVPSLLAVSENVPGFATALMYMVEGDRWRIIIPYYLAYGDETNSSSTIPAYSTLIFDAILAKIYRYQIDTNTDWY